MHIYCSGIGGIGLSAYASLQKTAGHDLSGSDRASSSLIENLQEMGMTIYLDQSGKHISKDIDLLVYSEAIPDDAPERRRAAELGIPQESYPEALGKLSHGYEVIAVCGTHGKSSTTAMAARLLIKSGKDPTVVVGTKLQELEGRNWRIGKSNIFLLEACEYRHSFMHYDPKIILLTNADGDHFDYYKSLEMYREAFVGFVKKLEGNGMLITHGDDPDCRSIAEGSGAKWMDADTYPLISLGTPGEHMQQNARLVLGLAKMFDISPSEATEILEGYRGSWRRMEERGSYQGIPVIDDYGHHPREIRATLAAMRGKYPKHRIVAVFQPHTHDRILKLYEDFIESFGDADVVIVSSVYDARPELEAAEVDLPKLASDIARKSEVEVINGGGLDEIEKKLTTSILQPGDLLVCLGAGDITKLAGSMSQSTAARTRR